MQTLLSAKIPSTPTQTNIKVQLRNLRIYSKIFLATKLVLRAMKTSFKQITTDRAENLNTLFDLLPEMFEVHDLPLYDNNLKTPTVVSREARKKETQEKKTHG